MAWIDLTKELSKKGQNSIKVGDVLIFDFEGSPIHLKIMRKKNGKVWAKRNYLYLPDEVEIKDRLEWLTLVLNRPAW